MPLMEARMVVTYDNGRGVTQQVTLNRGNVGIGTTAPVGRLHASDVADFYLTRWYRFSRRL